MAAWLLLGSAARSRSAIADRLDTSDVVAEWKDAWGLDLKNWIVKDSDRIARTPPKPEPGKPMKPKKPKKGAGEKKANDVCEALGTGHRRVWKRLNGPDRERGERRLNQQHRGIRGITEEEKRGSARSSEDES